MTDDANSFITMGLCWLLTFLSITAHIFQVWDVRSQKGQNLWQKACSHSYLLKVVNSCCTNFSLSTLWEVWWLDNHLNCIVFMCSILYPKGHSALVLPLSHTGCLRCSDLAYAWDIGRGAEGEAEGHLGRLWKKWEGRYTSSTLRRPLWCCESLRALYLFILKFPAYQNRPPRDFCSS